MSGNVGIVDMNRNCLNKSTRRKMKNLTNEEHKKRHIELHKAFDELLADYLQTTGKLPYHSSLRELMEWSYSQTVKPTEKKS